MPRQELPLIDLFPLTTRPHSCHDLSLADAGIKALREIKIFESPISLIKAIIDSDGTGEAATALDDALKSSAKYKAWQKSVPKLKDVPNLKAYRTQKKNKNDIGAINTELENIGAFLSSGQILYRGGHFPSEEFIIDRDPVSTSMHPSVARWHALTASKQIGVLRIVHSGSVVAFPYGTSGNQQLKQEFEVLLQGGLLFRQISSQNYGGLDIKFYDISTNNGVAPSEYMSIQ